MSRAASAAASLPLRNSSLCRTLPEARNSTARGASARIWVVMLSTSFDEIGEKRHAQPLGQARGLRLLAHRARRAGLDTAQAALAVAVVHAHQLALQEAPLLALIPHQ